MKGMLPHSTHTTNSSKGNTKSINIYFHKTYSKAIGFLIRTELVTISYQREKDTLEMKNNSNKLNGIIYNVNYYVYYKPLTTVS